MSTLYELTAEYQSLLELAEDPESDPQAIADTFEGLEFELESKAEDYAKVIRMLEYDAAACDAESKRLRNKKLSIESNIKRMKAALQSAMVATGKTKFKTKLFSFGIRKSPASVVIDDPKMVPPEFLIPQEPQVDKRAIKDALKEGTELGFAHLEQVESLSIK